MRRSTRKGIQKTKAKIKATFDYLDAPDHKVLSGALPGPKERDVSKQTFHQGPSESIKARSIGIAAREEAKCHGLGAIRTIHSAHFIHERW